MKENGINEAIDEALLPTNVEAIVIRRINDGWHVNIHTDTSTTYAISGFWSHAQPAFYSALEAVIAQAGRTS